MAKKEVETVEEQVVAPEEVTPETETVAEAPEAEEKTVEQLADEVDRGVHGSGRERMIVLGSRYEEVQAEVNRRFKESIKL